MQQALDDPYEKKTTTRALIRLASEYVTTEVYQ